MKQLLILTALLSLTACDYVEKAQFKAERNDRDYRTAMDEYRAGRLDLALSGFQRVCVDNPSNASARFQLACLLQDVKKDYLAAYCAYHEYLQQCPSSDKAKLASSRMADCERALVSALAAKHGLGSVQDEGPQIAEMLESLKKAESLTKKLTNELQNSKQRVAALEQENARLKSYVNDESEPDSSEISVPADIAEAKELFDEVEEDDSPSVGSSEVAEMKALLEEVDEEPLIRQPLEAKAKRDAERAAEKPVAEAKPTKVIPESYVVQEGDTLYKIAIKFYGRSSAWKNIREANKTIISTDGRVRAGQKIVLPRE